MPKNTKSIPDHENGEIRSLLACIRKIERILPSLNLRALKILLRLTEGFSGQKEK
jgi:hypothetical protein